MRNYEYVYSITYYLSCLQFWNLLIQIKTNNIKSLKVTLSKFLPLTYFDPSLKSNPVYLTG